MVAIALLASHVLPIANNVEYIDRGPALAYQVYPRSPPPKKKCCTFS